MSRLLFTGPGHITINSIAGINYPRFRRQLTQAIPRFIRYSRANDGPKCSSSRCLSFHCLGHRHTLLRLPYRPDNYNQDVRSAAHDRSRTGNDKNPPKTKTNKILRDESNRIQTKRNMVDELLCWIPSNSAVSSSYRRARRAAEDPRAYPSSKVPEPVLLSPCWTASKDACACCGETVCPCPAVTRPLGISGLQFPYTPYS
ncbi:hypothetical protein B0I35DRAFT_1093 [Stachybotrys elegans]|uniref:Uncharacterized protein n=1 Tax=Stachybotrys elegans TaxID=80388 RepID=A0A8K0SZI5_9HYPO|nr:hypothetical protein B0I35DRAFT_1093 [Stachybotrys elegans]